MLAMFLWQALLEERKRYTFLLDRTCAMVRNYASHHSKVSKQLYFLFFNSLAAQLDSGHCMMAGLRSNWYFIKETSVDRVFTYYTV